MMKNSKQQTKRQQRKSQQANQQPAAGKPQTPFAQQLESERKRLQQAGEIGGVAGVDIGDKRS